MKRRILNLFCVLALCLALLPATALAADDWTYVQSGRYIQSADGQLQLDISRDDPGKLRPCPSCVCADRRRSLHDNRDRRRSVLRLLRPDLGVFPA